MRIILFVISLFCLVGCAFLPPSSSNVAVLSNHNGNTEIEVDKYYRGMCHGPISCLFSEEGKSIMYIQTNKDSGKIYPGEFTFGEHGEYSSEKMQGYIELSGEKIIIALNYYYSEAERHKDNYFNGEYKLLNVNR